MNLKTSIHKYPEGNQNKNFPSFYYLKSVVFFFIAALFLYSSCSSKRTDNNSSVVIKADTLIPPVFTLIRNPVVINSDTCPPPQTITIPIQPGNTTINLGGRLIK